VLVKRLAGIVNILQAVMVIFFAAFTVPSGSCGGASGACSGLSLTSPLAPLLVVGILLLVDGLVCVIERWPAFLVGIILSLITIVEVAINWGKVGGGGPDFLVGSAVIAVVAIALNAKALVSRPPIAEENHPLNLPVFG
jgi:hypothetical protein